MSGLISHWAHLDSLEVDNMFHNYHSIYKNLKTKKKIDPVKSIAQFLITEVLFTYNM